MYNNDIYFKRCYACTFISYRDKDSGSKQSYFCESVSSFQFSKSKAIHLTVISAGFVFFLKLEVRWGTKEFTECVIGNIRQRRLRRHVFCDLSLNGVLFSFSVTTSL